MSRELKIGLVVTGAIVLLIYGFNFLKGYNLLSPRKEFVGTYSSVEGLVEANPVILNGLKVGQVTEIKLHPLHTDSVMVRFSVDESIELFDSSKATIISSDLLGSKAVELKIGKLGKSGNKLMPGAFVRSGLESSLEDAVKEELRPLQAKVENLLGGLEEVTVVIQEALNEEVRNNLTKGMERIPIAIRNLENATVKIDTLVTVQSDKLANIFSNIESISYSLRQSNSDIKRIIANTAELTDSLTQACLKDAICNANDAILASNEIMRKINEGEGSMGLLLNDSTLYNNLAASTASVDSLLTEINKNPHKFMHISLIDFHKQ